MFIFIYETFLKNQVIGNSILLWDPCGSFPSDESSSSSHESPPELKFRTKKYI